MATKKKTTKTKSTAVQLHEAMQEHSTALDLAAPFSAPAAKVRTEDGAADCAAALYELKKLRDAIEAKRKFLVAPLKQESKRIDSEAKVLRDQVDAHIKTCTAVLADYEDHQRAKALKAAKAKAKRLAAKGSEQMALEVVKQAEESKPVAFDGLKSVRTRVAEVTDPQAFCSAVAGGEIPLEAVSFSASWLNKQAKAGVEALPGVTFSYKTTFSR